MSKCRCCGEEIGTLEICPICGTKVVLKKVQKAPLEPKPQIKNEEDKQNLLKEIEAQKINLIETCAKAVTKILKRTSNGYSTGTGFITKDNYIITNAHVICHGTSSYDGEAIQVEFSDKLNLGSNKMIYARVLYYDVLKDVAILSPLASSFPPEVIKLEITDREPRQGEKVFTIGNPLHYKFTYTEGAVANPSYPAGGRFGSEVLQTTLNLISGNSGGPVFDMDGKVLGITTFSELNNQQQEIYGYGFCVKSKTILNAIKDIRRI